MMEVPRKQSTAIAVFLYICGSLSIGGALPAAALVPQILAVSTFFSGILGGLLLCAVARAINLLRDIEFNTRVTSEHQATATYTDPADLL